MRCIGIVRGQKSSRRFDIQWIYAPSGAIYRRYTVVDS